jgi:hypothetical protein
MAEGWGLAGRESIRGTGAASARCIAMAPRLKVFSWSDGFHAFSVAASSRPKALAAWGIERDIFRDGLAREIHEGPDYDAALARPGEVVERGLAVDVGEMAPRRSSKADARSRAAKEKVEALQADLDALDRRQGEERDALEAEAQRIARALSDLAARQERDRDRLAKRIRKARENSRSDG